MTANPMVLPTLALAYLLFWGGRILTRRTRSAWQLGLALAAAGLLAVPAILMAIQYLHLFDSWTAFFYEFRSMRGSELAAAGVGVVAGMISCWPKLRMLRLLVVAVVLSVVTMCVALPYVKPLLAPARFSDFNDSWDAAVCRQSTIYSCGPACGATLLRHFGIHTSELEIARECHTYMGGTENWYLARALRSRGLQVSFITATTGQDIPVPSIAGVKTGGAGHFVAILEDLGDSYRLGDPLIGASICPKAKMAKRYQFTGFFMMVEKRKE